ncbi:MAG TPA: exodeoxyribonuclease V subunit alpha [Gemmatimonas sp.]|uniref:exodeoxyribonuclease V subunit alpha n=1 Tax=Gemmatimonas sp. TaxID=1962908 RepID=UPI002EDA5AAB
MNSVVTPVELSPLDDVFAEYVMRTALARGTDAVSSPAMVLLADTARLVSAERTTGNSCVDLAEYAGRSVTLGRRVVRWPDLAEWQHLLRHSGVSVSGDITDALHLSALTLDGSRLYLTRYHRAETRLARAMQRLMTASSGGATAAPSARFAALFPPQEGRVDWQARAAEAALRWPLVFVTGGPGTGKTTVAARLLALLLDRDPTLTIALAAPTGRAAARLLEAVSTAAVRDGLHELDPVLPQLSGRTLHRLLGYHPATQRFRYGAHRPLAEDVVIVDEASMVDVLMMDALFAALKPSARLIVLGDPDQLASVDTGFVLGDVTRAAESPVAQGTALERSVVRLAYSWRFGQQVGIGRLADAARLGDGAGAMAALQDASLTDVAWQEPHRSAAELLRAIEPQVQAFLTTTAPADALTTLGRFRVLCALRDGPTGVTGLNALIESWLQRQGRSIAGWYDHRPVLITANDPATQLFNGDVGVCLAADGMPMVHFPAPDGGVRSFAPAQLPMHETAWAMTVHKSQGSEFDHVLIVLPDADSRVLTRELLYTAVTRARRAVTVVGTDTMIEAAIHRSVVRGSGLTDRLLAGATSRS